MKTFSTFLGLTLLALALSMAIISCVGILAGCTPQKAAATVTDAEALAVCILNHYGEPPAQVAAECGGVAVSVVEDIFAAHKAAMQRELAAKDGGR